MNRIDFSKAPNGASALRIAVAQFVWGVRGKRRTPVHVSKIVAWFAATPETMIHEAIAGGIHDGHIVSGRDGYESIHEWRPGAREAVIS